MLLNDASPQVNHRKDIQISSGWSQGRTVYGGLVAGLLMQNALDVVANPHQQVLSCSVTFVGSVKEGAAQLTAEILRKGKSVTTIEVRLWQAGAVQSILLASFGEPRSSEIVVHQLPEAPDYLLPAQLSRMPYVPLMPECYQQFDLRWAEGHYPISNKLPDFGGWCRFDPELHGERAFNVADLLILMDIWPPGVLPMFQQIAPASSLTWHLSFVRPIEYALHDWFKYKVVTQHAAFGYATEYAHLWDAQNRLIAISRQTVTVFA
ncbi:thioesterase family protein [Acinetobacter soli]|uniref:thioesterase family protein n=1 Tax=Acinetobacter soli TaxID=487316 RepID=UPI0026E05957|nr:thioesterase family protein [Acinetobacter soli]